MGKIRVSHLFIYCLIYAPQDVLYNLVFLNVLEMASSLTSISSSKNYENDPYYQDHTLTIDDSAWETIFLVFSYQFGTCQCNPKESYTLYQFKGLTV